MRIVLALGGNVLTGVNESVRVDHQIAAVEAASAQVAHLVAQGHQLLLSHGNGPQVGNILAKNDIAAYFLSPVPLDWCVANTQGSIGFILLNALSGALQEQGLEIAPTVLVSRTVVDPEDPAFSAPTKPIGRHVDVETAERLIKLGQTWVDHGDAGWRRVVPSPRPLRIIEAPAISALLDAGFLVVGGGGGGIPVVEKSPGHFTGVEAVIDKDLNSVLLADQISADTLVPPPTSTTHGWTGAPTGRGQSARSTWRPCVSTSPTGSSRPARWGRRWTRCAPSSRRRGVAASSRGWRRSPTRSPARRAPSSSRNGAPA